MGDAVLETQLGMWRIQICKDQDSGLICFQKGWPDFVLHHGLNVGDLVLFEHTRNFHFKVTVFDHSACEKEFIVHVSDDEDPPALNIKRKHSEMIKAPDVVFQSQNPFFVLTMRPCYALSSRARIPQVFWKLNYINDKKRLVVRGGGGKEWRVDPFVQKRKTGAPYCRLGKRWSEFYANSNLKDGDVCVFELRNDAVGGSKDDAVMDFHIYPQPA